MANKTYQVFTFNDEVTENAFTYYDLDINEKETQDHKHKIIASASVDGQYSDSAKEIQLTLTGVPNLADPDKFNFDTANCKVTKFAGNTEINNELVRLNENTDSKVAQLFGILDSYMGVDRRIAFRVTENLGGSGSKEYIRRHNIGAFDGVEEYSYNESSRTLTFTYVGVSNSPAAYDTISPFEVQFVGTETWVKQYDNTYSYYLYADECPTVYLGKKIELSELCNMAICYDVESSAPTRNGYPWPDGAETSAANIQYKKVEVADLVNKVAASDNFKIQVNLNMADSDGFNVVLTYDAEVVSLSETPFINFQPEVTAYAVGDTINLNSIATDCRKWENAVLTYTDGKTIALSEIELADNSSISATMSIKISGETKTNLRSLTIQNLVAYDDCQITLTIPTKHFGTLTYTYDVEITESLAFALVLNNVKTDFKYGEIAEYGEGATATLYDSLGNEIPVDDDSVSALLSSGVIKADQKILTRQALLSTSDVNLDGVTGQGIITTTLQNANYFKHLVYVSYCDNFELSQTNLGDFYVNKGEITSVLPIVNTVTGRYTYHHNTATEKDTEVVELAFGDMSVSALQLEANSNINNFQLTFSVTPDETPLQTLTKKVSFNVIINKLTGLSVEHEATGNTYYVGRSNTFVLPNDLTVKKVFNNPALAEVDLTAEEIVSLQFRTSEGRNSEALVPTVSTIPASQNVIYVTLELADGTILQGSYSIAGDYQQDVITSFTLDSGFDFTLGNKLSTYKNNGDLVLTAHYASGYTTTVTSDLYFIVQGDGVDFLDYEKVIMESSELSTIYVKHNGSYYAVPTNGLINPIVPTGHITFTNYQKTFVNKVDKIDFSEAVAVVTYEDTNSAATVEASLDSGNVATDSTFALALTGITDFDGSETFDLQEDGVTFSKTLTISVKNRFDTTQTITATVTLSVISISTLSFTRLVIRNPQTIYKVGDAFLNTKDNTVLHLYYEGSSAPIEVYLKDVPTIVGTDPSQGTVFTRTNDSMVVTVRLLSDPTKYTTYTARVVSFASENKVLTRNVVAIFVANNVTTGIEEFDREAHYYYDENKRLVASGRYVLVDSSYTTIASDGSRVLNAGISLQSITIYGWLEDLFHKGRNARVILFNDFIPPVSSEANIEVKYPCHVNGNADKINKCHIAKLFGNNNAKNRLFVSGNPDFGNCDWHSGAVNEYVQQGEVMDSNGDFTYFGDMDYCFYGQTDNNVMGYDHIATNKMIVLKSKSKVEPTNYFRSSSLTQAMDAGGNIVSSITGSTLYMESFPCDTGNIGAGAMNINSIVNLNGDTLYLSSDNRICGLNIAGQVGDSQRISTSRSYFIDPELKNLDLSDAVLWSDNESVFLFTKEATYASHIDTYDAESGQYEWFKIDAKGARCAISIDDEIFFGASDGSLYKMDKRIFYDCDKIFIESGGTLYVTLSTLFSDNKIIYANGINGEIDENANYTFTMLASNIRNSLFRKVASINNLPTAGTDLAIDYDSNTIKVVAIGVNGRFDGNKYSALLDELNQDGAKFYLNHADGDSAIVGAIGSPLTEYFRSYTLKPTESEEDAYKMVDANGNEVQLSRMVTSEGVVSRVSLLASAMLCRVLDGEYDVVDLNKADCSFKLQEHGRELDIVLYGTQNLASASFESELHKHTPVKSYFVAAPAVLGGIEYRKTIWSWTLTAFKEANDLQVGAATNEENLDAMKTLAFADNVPIGKSFHHFSFEHFDFEKANVPRKYTYFRPLLVPFISFGFKSDKPENSILTETSIVYTIPLMGRGNR